MEFSAKVRDLLIARGLSQSDLAETIGTNQQQISRWLEEGATLPKAAYLLKIAKALNVSTDFLIDDSIERPPIQETMPDDETHLLRVYRNLKRTGAIDEDLAVTGLMRLIGSTGPAGQPATAQGIQRDPKSGAPLKKQRGTKGVG